MRRPIRGNIRVGVPITLEPGPDRISPPKRVSTVYHGPGFAKHPSGRCRTLRKIFAVAVIHRRFIVHRYRRGCPAGGRLAMPSPALRPPGSSTRAAYPCRRPSRPSPSPGSGFQAPRRDPRLVGMHRGFIAHCYRRGCPATAPDRLHNNLRNGCRAFEGSAALVPLLGCARWWSKRGGGTVSSLERQGGEKDDA